MSDDLPLLYSHLAEWWPLLSAPEEYAEEAQLYLEAITSNSSFPPQTLLELGSGGGNNAFHLKKSLRLTLVDLSPGMLEVSRAVNPECRHVLGDMRRIRLDQVFDAVFIHDAISYMASRQDLRLAVRTAFEHCRPGGVSLFVPDWTRESYRPTTGHGGHDRADRGLRYLEWSLDPDPGGSTYRTFMIYLLREGQNVRASAVDQHLCGLFHREEWLKIIAEAGFEPRLLPFEHSELEKGSHYLFLGLKPGPPPAD